MKKAKSQFPPQVEWDFRKIDDVETELDSAIIYEYARTATACKAASDFLAKKINGKAVRQHILKAIQAAQKRGQSQPCFSDYPPGIASTIHQNLTSYFNNGVGAAKIATIIMNWRPDFPAPWLASRPMLQANKNHSRIELLPQFPADEFLGQDCFILKIDFHNATIDEISADFEQKLRQIAKTRAEMKSRGRAGQLPVAHFAWLAAYRLQKAGVTFDKAQDRLRGESDFQKYLPKYSDKSAWSDAIKKARKLFADLRFD